MKSKRSISRNLITVTSATVIATSLAIGGAVTVSAHSVNGSPTTRQGNSPSTSQHQNDPQHQRATGNGGGNKNGKGSGNKGADKQHSATSASTVGTLTDEQKKTLEAWAQEEKMAHDLYVVLGEKYPTVHQFEAIAKSETTHLDAVKKLLGTYSIPDPTATPAGVYPDGRIQNLYDTLLASATDERSALDAGVTVEETDIADLTAMKNSITAPNVLRVVDKQIAASKKHLTAFSE